MHDLNYLSQKKSELQKKISEFQNLSSTGTQKILDAIKSQRWFFFENNEKIIFDRDTALIWANLNYFAWKKSSVQDTYSHENYYSEVSRLINDTNKKKFGNYDDWRVPTNFELWKIVYDRKFPFCEGGFRIKNKFSWCVEYIGKLAGKDLDVAGADSEIISSRYVYVIPCNDSVKPQNYSYSPENVLKIFIENKFIPIFDNREITQLYKKIFINGESVDDLKNQLENQLAEIEKQIEKENKNLKLTANFY